VASAAAAGVSLAQLIGSAPSQIAYFPLETGAADVDNIRIVSSGGITRTGRVLIEGRPQTERPEDLTRLSIALTRDPDLILMPPALMPLPPVPPPPPGTPPTPRPSNGQVTASGDFTLFMSMGDYRLGVNGVPPNLYVRSMRMGGADVLVDGLKVPQGPDSLLEIVLAGDGGALSGQVVDNRSMPLANVVVALAPDSPDLRRVTTFYKSMTTDFNGEFSFTTIPPGEYKLFAWEYTQPDSWQNAEFIRTFENSGKPVRIAPGSTQKGIQLTAFPKR
jgi:hypothetical protein